MRTRQSSLMIAVILAGTAVSHGAQAAGRVPGPPIDGSPRCYVGFLHGSGTNSRTNPNDALEYWRRNGDERSSLIGAVSYAGCATTSFTYDGTASWYAETASIASQINNFVDSWNIQDKQLILVGHSMGGVVLRWMLNNGEPNSPYFNHEGAALDRIVRKTKYAITLQAPHTGSEAADAIYGEATFASASVIIGGIGWISNAPSDARNTMRRRYMDLAEAWMGDAGRSTILYTIGGHKYIGSGSGLSPTDGNDFLLSQLAHVMGLGPPHSDNEFYNDGMVELDSAFGYTIWKETAWQIGWPFWYWTYTSGHDIGGARRLWAGTALNHNHGRYAYLSSSFSRPGSASVNMDLGQKLRDHGLQLPCSDPSMSSVYGCASF